jgi:hypothetical protein
MHSDAPKADIIDPTGSGTDPEAVSQAALITTAYDSSLHRTKDFVCTKSPRIAGFFANEAQKLVPNYCRLFIAANPDDPSHIWGYYTLSAALLLKGNLVRADENRASKNYMGLPAPMVRIGFMGRDDSAPKKFGSALIVDAARRIYRNPDIAAWGIVLESEGGRENTKLWAWYEAQGFKPCRDTHLPSMYAPLSAFLPELQVNR